MKKFWKRLSRLHCRYRWLHQIYLVVRPGKIHKLLDRIYGKLNPPKDRALGLINLWPTRETRKANKSLKSFRVWKLSGWEWKNPGNPIADYERIFRNAYISDRYIKDLREVTHFEYFPGLTTEKALDKLAERYYGNNK